MIPEYALVTIENELFFGPGISLITATHKTSLQSSRDNFEYAEPITIGDDCWFGANGTVIHGVAVDKAYTVGTGSIGTKDIPEYSVAVGVPARVVKEVENVP
jgi:acetyltransferase-like isoleucine patch superfamily enzyme